MLEEYKRVYREVVKREEREIFKKHLYSYIVANIIMAGINYTLTPNYYWFIYPLFGWGIGVFFHYLAAIKFIDKTLERRENLAMKELGE